MDNITTNTNRPPDFTTAAAMLKNIIFILTAAVSFALWLSSTITMPKRIDKLEEAVSALTRKQDALDAQAGLIRGDLQEIKAAIIKKI